MSMCEQDDMRAGHAPQTHRTNDNGKDRARQTQTETQIAWAVVGGLCQACE